LHLSHPIFKFSACFLFTASLIAQTPQRFSPLLLPQEPATNLGQIKIKLTEYHDCIHPGCYVPELDRQSNRAIAYLKRRAATAKPGEKLALILDIDETSLSNWDEEKRDDFGFIASDWDAWAGSEKAPAIAGTLRLYREAQSLGVAVFFITGRDERLREITALNLKNAGYENWAGLALRGQHAPEQTTIDYKSAERRKIVDAGYRIILNVGDQLSDLKGNPQAEMSIKLPNPFYYIP